MAKDRAIVAIDLVKKKLQKYTALQEHDKIKEYLHKLHTTCITSLLLQETRIDRVVRQLAADRTASYGLSAKILLKKWHKQKLLPKSSSAKKTLTEEEKNSVSSESQSSEEKKQRKVLSLAQYLETKKQSSSPAKSDASPVNKLTDTEIEVINAQFNAATEKLAVNASDLATTVNKSLSQIEKPPQHRPAAKSTPVKNDDLWAEEEDDDDDDDIVPLAMNTW